MDDLYSDAEFYDLVAPAAPDMERFYVERAAGPGRSVLELACGTGRFTLPMAASGASVVGGDLSQAMLDRGRSIASDRGVAVEFIELDMRDFNLGRTFDSVVIAANSLMHLHTMEDFDRALTAIRAHLAPGGRLLFDIFVPSARLLSLPAHQRQIVGCFPHASLGGVTVEETIAYDPISQVSRADWYWSAPARPDFRKTRLELRQIYPQELQPLLERSGFTLAERYGDFLGTPLTPKSWRQVCVAATG